MAQPPQPMIYVTQAPIQHIQLRLNEYPVLCTCPNCHAQIQTRLGYQSGLFTYALAGGACLIGLWAGCCLIPFCLDITKDVKHFCPQCNFYIGLYKRIS